MASCIKVTKQVYCCKRDTEKIRKSFIKRKQVICYKDTGKITGRQGSENAGNLFVAEYRENMYDRRESLNFCEKIYFRILQMSLCKTQYLFSYRSRQQNGFFLTGCKGY